MDEENMGKIFYKNTAVIICLLIVMFCSNGSSRADMGEAELFEKAYEYYLTYNPDKAIETFDLFLQQFPDSSALDSVLFWRAKSLMQMKRIEDADRSFRKLREVFPESAYSLFAEKEIETIKNLLQKVDKSDIVREKTATTSDAKMPVYEDRIRKLEAEKIDLEKQLSEAEKNRQLTEKGLSKALDDKNVFESQLDELKRNRDALVQKTLPSEKADKELAGFAEEKKALEAMLKEREEKIRNLTDELSRNDEKIALITREFSEKIQQSQKDWEKLDLHIKELTAQNIALGNAVKEKDKFISDSQQTIASMKMNITDSQASKQRELENANQLLSQLASEKVILSEEVATEKKKADELLAKVRAKDETIQRFLSDEAGRKAADAEAGARLKQSGAELAKVKAEREGLQSRIRTLESHDQERKDLAVRAEEAKKLREEITLNTAEFERLRKENSRLLDDKKGLETRLSESQEKSRAAALSMDTAAEKEKKSLLAESRELEKKLRDAATQVGQLLDDRQKIDAVLKERDQSLAKSQETIALLEKTLKGSEQDKSKQQQELEARAAKSKDALAQLEDSRKKQEELATVSALNEKERARLKAERAELEARLSVVDKGRNETDRALKKVSDEKLVTEAQLKDQQAKLAKSQETVALLEKTIKESEQDKSKQQQELAELKKINDQHATRNAELAGEVSALRTQSLDYEKPFLRVGKERYTLAAVMRESMISRNVTDKIQSKNVLWRTGNIIDDFIAEQILARKAREETISADSSVKASLVKQYALTAAEGAYLDKYLAIDGLVKKRLAVPAITEKNIREYYDKHREQYLHKHENRIRVLSVKYGKTDELDQSLVAVEIQQEALEGRPFDAIARKRAAAVTMREMSLSRLPDWAAAKLAGLKEGEVSTIISTDSEFIIVQPILSKSAYRSFEEIRKDIEKTLSAEQPGQKQDLEDWLNSLKKDAEILR